MGWQFFAVLQILLSVVDALYHRSTAQLAGLNSRSKAALTHLLGIFPVGLVWAFTHGGIDLSFDKFALVYGVFAGIAIALGSLFVWKAAETIDAANLNIILMLRAVVVVVIASVFLSEVLTVSQILGAALVVVAGYVASRHDKKDLRSDKKGALFATIGAVLFGIGLTLEKATLDMMTFETYLVIGWGLQTIAILVFASKALKRDGLKRISAFAPRLFLLGTLVGASGLVYLTALSLSDNAPLVVSFINLKVVGIVVGGYIFLRERGGIHHKIAGALIALLGFILLIG